MNYRWHDAHEIQDNVVSFVESCTTSDPHLVTTCVETGELFQELLDQQLNYESEKVGKRERESYTLLRLDASAPSVVLPDIVVDFHPDADSWVAGHSPVEAVDAAMLAVQLATTIKEREAKPAEIDDPAHSLVKLTYEIERLETKEKEIKVELEREKAKHASPDIKVMLKDPLILTLTERLVSVGSILNEQRGKRGGLNRGIIRSDEEATRSGTHDINVLNGQLAENDNEL